MTILKKPLERPGEISPVRALPGVTSGNCGLCRLGGAREGVCTDGWGESTPSALVGEVAPWDWTNWGPPFWYGDSLGLTTANGRNSCSRGCKPYAIGRKTDPRHDTRTSLVEFENASVCQTMCASFRVTRDRSFWLGRESFKQMLSIKSWLSDRGRRKQPRPGLAAPRSSGRRPAG